MLAGAPLALTPTPASAASCQTNPDVGDFCKVLEVLCNNKVWQKVSDDC
jgi:hypothetical protein